MISYETWCQIRDCHDRLHMKLGQIAKALHLHPRTVARWARMLHFEAWKKVVRNSLLDPFKGQVTLLLDSHPFSAQQVFQRLRESGYTGGYTTVKDYVRLIRPQHHPAFLKLVFAPGKAAQGDRNRCLTAVVQRVEQVDAPYGTALTMIKMPAHDVIFIRPLLLLDGVVKNEYAIIALYFTYH